MDHSPIGRDIGYSSDQNIAHFHPQAKFEDREMGNRIGMDFYSVSSAGRHTVKTGHPLNE